jgi:hypothetical protein
MKLRLLFVVIAAAALGASCSDSKPASTSNTVAANQQAIAPPGVPAGNTNNSGSGSVRPVLQFEPFDEDSEIATAADRNGHLYQQRIYKKHPELLKVVLNWVDENTRSLEIMLRTGEKKQVTTSRVLDLKKTNATELLELIGMTPAAANKNAVKKAR